MFAISFNGIGKLHFTHLVVAVVCGLSIMVMFPYIRPFESTPYPETLAVQKDYEWLHKIALPVVIMNGVVALMALSVLLLNLITKSALRLPYEAGGSCLAICSYIANIVLLGLAFPEGLFYMMGGEAQRFLGSASKLSELDTAAVFRNDWLIMQGLHIFLLIILIIHTGWHVATAARHRVLRPSVWFEPISGSYAWSLAPAPQPQFEYAVGLTDGFNGLGSERAKEWLYTSGQTKSGSVEGTV